MGYVHIVFIIFFLESVLSTTRGTGHTLACSPFVVWFGDAVMYNGALICFKYKDGFRCC